MTRAYHRPRPRRRFALLLALALMVTGLTVLGPTGTAGAADGDPVIETWSDPPTVDGSCGFRTTFTTTGTLTRTIKPATGQGDGFPLVTEKISYEDTYADPDSGDVLFTVRGNFQFKMIKAKPLGDGLYEVTAKDSGLIAAVQDSKGRQRGHDSGAVTYKFVADHDGNFVDFLSEHSPGPERKSTCAIVGSFLGSDSASRLTAHPKSPSNPFGFYEYLPPDYDAEGAKSPLLLFFHGFGGSGDGSAEQLPFVINDAAIPLYISTNNWPADRPFVVLAPQHNSIDDVDYPYNCQDPFGGTCVMQQQHDYRNPPEGSPCTTPDEVVKFLKFAVANYNVDPSRVYLTGLSCGAYGVWEALPELGDRVAAAVPIAGNGEPSFESTDCEQWVSPIWAFHGDADDVVDFQNTVRTINGLKSCTPPQPDLGCTIYPGVDHNSWDRAYTGTGEEDVFKWMLGQRTGELPSCPPQE